MSQNRLTELFAQHAKKRSIYPCPKCRSEISLQTVPNLSASDHAHYFIIHCNECGYGPSSAYASIDESIQEWNCQAREAHECVSEI